MFARIIKKIKRGIANKRYGEYPHIIPQKILGNEKFIALDIGAAIGIPSHWSEILNFGFIYGFEPNQSSAKELQNKYDPKHYKVIQEALSQKGGMQKIYLTNIPTGSSLLEPNMTYKYVIPNYFMPWKEEFIQTKIAEEVLKNYKINNVDSVKIDTQGTELEILMSFGPKYLNKILSVEFEAGIPGAYNNQMSFFETHQFMVKNNFELFDLKPARANIYLENGLPYKNTHTVTPKIHEVDVLYFKNLEYLLNNKDKSKLKKLIISYCVYSFFDEAYLAAKEAYDVEFFSKQELISIQQAITDWHDNKSHFTNHWFNYSTKY